MTKTHQQMQSRAYRFQITMDVGFCWLLCSVQKLAPVFASSSRQADSDECMPEYMPMAPFVGSPASSFLNSRLCTLSKHLGRCLQCNSRIQVSGITCRCHHSTAVMTVSIAVLLCATWQQVSTTEAKCDNAGQHFCSQARRSNST